VTEYRDAAPKTAQIIVTTGPDVAGFRITEYLGIARGIVVRSTSLGQGIVGAFRPARRRQHQGVR
jgi:uncharacterized protein YbjQ (UPF0145 family)